MAIGQAIKFKVEGISYEWDKMVIIRGKFQEIFYGLVYPPMIEVVTQLNKEEEPKLDDNLRRSTRENKEKLRLKKIRDMEAILSGKDDMGLGLEVVLIGKIGRGVRVRLGSS